jgi:hypothetical protein
MNIIYEEVVKRINGKNKLSPSNWNSCNGVCCIHNGQSRPDTRKRAGIKLDGGAFVYHCFNCNFAVKWQPGMLLSKKIRNLLSWLGTPHELIMKLNFKAWQLNQQVLSGQELPKREYRTKIHFDTKQLPEDSMPISWWLESNLEDSNFRLVCDYLLTRGDRIASEYEYHWTPKKEYSRHVIIPCRWNSNIVGWTARACFNSKYRYYSELPDNYIFNIDQINDPHRKYIFLVEGPFDAIAINGIASFGNTLNSIQCEWLQESGKDIIVIPDHSSDGQPLIDIALKNGWYVSIPEWGDDIKDCADAVKKHGRLWTIWQIINNATNQPLRINMLRKIRIHG